MDGETVVEIEADLGEEANPAVDLAAPMGIAEDGLDLMTTGQIKLGAG